MQRHVCKCTVQLSREMCYQQCSLLLSGSSFQWQHVPGRVGPYFPAVSVCLSEHPPSLPIEQTVQCHPGRVVPQSFHSCPSETFNERQSKSCLIQEVVCYPARLKTALEVECSATAIVSNQSRKKEIINATSLLYNGEQSSWLEESNTQFTL